MTLFNRSLAREFAGIGAGAVAVLLAIFVTRLVVQFVARAASGVIEPEAVGVLLAFSVLAYLPVVLGLALFIAVLLALTRSHRDSEMHVWFASGLSILAWVRPVLGFSLPVALAIAALSLLITPWSLEQSQAYQRRLEAKDDVSRITPGSFYESRASQRVAFVDTTSDTKAVVNNVFVETRGKDELSVVVAETGSQRTLPSGERYLVLSKGRQYEGVPGTVEYRVVDFEQYQMRIEAKEARPEALSTKALDSLDLLSNPTPERAAELHWRIALPISALMLALFAIPLAFVNPRSGRSWNLVLAILVFVLYYQTLSIFQAWTAQGRISIWLGLWPVHGAMLLMLAMLFFRQVVAFRWLAFARK